VPLCQLSLAGRGAGYDERPGDPVSRDKAIDSAGIREDRRGGSGPLATDRPRRLHAVRRAVCRGEMQGMRNIR